MDTELRATLCHEQPHTAELWMTPNHGQKAPCDARIAKKVEVYFDNLWKLAHLNFSAQTKTVSDQQWQTDRKVPCWSHFVDSKERCSYVRSLF
ncbi:hypothetical protein FH972_012861 [Carpinus fangiana]|uniref:Uncharacterized protein n=1 Tax=Carpinus fangiana TaxID=176857 RepID=A0A5N6R6N3_9ROSI|nr:hypothetical protein FH972_012861 [Carpinus fangiana]